MFYIGCPMWGYKEWVGNGKFFPMRTAAHNFLHLYSQRLTAVEGNTIFYALPIEETVKRWAMETPETFRFCPKVSRSISHEASLAEKKEETLLFIRRMSGFGKRLGPAFLQLPPAFGPTQLSELQAFLDFWPSDVRLAVEVRHPAFYSSEHATPLNNLLSQYHTGRVMMDTRPIRTGSEQEQQMLQARERKPDLPLQIAVTTDFAFVRYIGHPRMEVNAVFLDSWAQQLAQWLKQGITVYLFCHCPYEEHSPDICVELYQRVKALVPLPELPWHLLAKDEDRPEQLNLF